MADSIFGLEGKCAVVTGGAQGIGAGCVDLFARAGANVVIADLQAAKAEEAAERARACGVGALAVEADVRDDADVARVTAASLEAFGAIDAAVNNAGGIPAYLEHRGAKSIFEVEWDYFDAIFDLNVKSVLRCSQSFAKAMIDGGVKGAIVNITSFQGYRALARPPRLRRGQGRRGAPDADHGLRAWPLRHQGQRRRAGLHRDRDDESEHVARAQGGLGASHAAGTHRRAVGPGGDGGDAGLAARELLHRPARHRRRRPERHVGPPAVAALSASHAPRPVTDVKTDILLIPFGATYPEMREAALAAEAAGFDGVWTWDHLRDADGGTGRVPECLTTLAALAEAVPRIALGSLVLNSGLRHPGVVANVAATIQEISGNRLILGIGAGGGSDLPYAPEQRMLGMEVAPDRERAARTGEAAQVLRRLWAGDASAFEGEHFTLRSPHGYPRPEAPPPIVIGGFGGRMARIAGRFGDGFNTPAGPSEICRTGRACPCRVRAFGPRPRRLSPHRLRRPGPGLPRPGQPPAAVVGAGGHGAGHPAPAPPLRRAGHRARRAAARSLTWLSSR